MKIRIIASLVALALLLPAFGSCGSKTGQTPKDTGTTVDTEPKQTDGIVIDLPDGSELPVKASWSHLGCFDHCAYETEDKELIAELMEALRNVEVSDEEGMDVTTDETDVHLYMSDGKEYRVTFNGSSLQIDDGKSYPYSLYTVASGFTELKRVLDKIGEKEEDLTELDITVANRSDNGSIALWDGDKIPVSVTHYFSRDTGMIYTRSTEDSAVINSLIEALKKVRVGEKIDSLAKGDCDIVNFVMEDGSMYEISFYGGNFYYGSYELEGKVSVDEFARYETEGFEDVRALLDKLDASDEQ